MCEVDLGGDVWIPGFDPAPEEPIDVALERDWAIGRWAESKGEFGDSPLGPDWNTWPLGDPGPCCTRLFVDLRDTADIGQALRYVHVHLRKCPETETVVFHVGGSIGFLDWSTAFQAMVPTLRIVAPDTTFATRVSASWLPRSGQRPGIWMGCIPRGFVGDNHVIIPFPVANFAAFRHRIWLLEELGLLKLRFSYVQHWNDQPDHPDFNLTHGLTFGEWIDAAGGMQEWSARVYFPAIGAIRYRMPPAGFHAHTLWRQIPPSRFGFGIGLHQFPPQGAIVPNNAAVVPESVAAMDGNPYAFLNEDAPQLADRRQ